MCATFYTCLLNENIVTVSMTFTLRMELKYCLQIHTISLLRTGFILYRFNFIMHVHFKIYIGRSEYSNTNKTYIIFLNYYRRLTWFLTIDHHSAAG